MSAKLTHEIFLQKATKRHGNKYDYSEVVYRGVFDKVIIKCPTHGKFLQTPNSHWECGCKKCGMRVMQDKNIRYTSKNFSLKASELHNNFYDYSKSIYVNLNSQLTIICPLHGEFTQKASKHLTRKHGCRKCASERASLELRDTIEDFLKKAYLLYGHYYDYSLVRFKTHHDKVTIICPKHGMFSQTVNSHLSGKRCTKCAKEQMIKDGSFYNFTKERWIKITKAGYLYLVELTDGLETFYKVGITSSIVNRFRYLKGYSYKILESLYLDKDLGTIWQLEKDFHLANQKYKYVPLKEINGSTECYIKHVEVLREFQRIIKN